jgi:hypothetical protein
MGASQVVAEWTATRSGHPGTGGFAVISHEAKASTGVLSDVGPGQLDHLFTRQVNSELLANGQTVKGQVVIFHLSRVIGISV